MPFPQDQIAWLLANRAKIVRYAFIPQLLAALVFLGFAYVTGNVHARLLRKGISTPGKIVGFKPVRMFERSSSGSTSPSRTVNMPIIEFRADDRIVRLQEWKASNSDPRLNSLVPVLYDPNNASIAMMDRGLWNWLPWAPCFAIGFIVGVAALKGLFLFFAKSDRDEPNLSPQMGDSERFAGK
jgi:hypothetical protein